MSLLTSQYGSCTLTATEAWESGEHSLFAYSFILVLGIVYSVSILTRTTSVSVQKEKPGRQWGSCGRVLQICELSSEIEYQKRFLVSLQTVCGRAAISNVPTLHALPMVHADLGTNGCGPVYQGCLNMCFCIVWSRGSKNGIGSGLHLIRGKRCFAVLEIAWTNCVALFSLSFSHSFLLLTSAKM